MAQGSPRTDLLSYPLYRDIRAQNKVFSGVLASGRSDRLDVRIDGGAGGFEHPRGRLVSMNYFAVLGVGAAAGRVFGTGDDESPGSSPIAVISDGYWTRRFHRAPATIGRSITINDLHVTIVGVTPPSFTGEIVGAASEIWLPVTMWDALHPHQRTLDDRNSSWLLLLGRTLPGVTQAQVREQLTPVITQSIVTNGRGAEGAAFVASSPDFYFSPGDKGFSRVRDTFHAPLVTLMIGVALLLCIICANIANLLLARSIARGREMAVRLALGANRGRLVRQLLTESIVLAVLGAAIGMLVAWWGSRGLLPLASGDNNLPLDLRMDVPVLAFTLVTSCLAVLLFGLVPALRASRVDLASTMRSGAHAVAGSALGQRGQRAPLGKLLIAGQVALSVVLLVGAGMLVRSLRNVQSIDVGMDRDHLLIVDLDITARGYRGPRLITLVRALQDRLATLPGVAAVGYSENGIFSGTESGMTIELPGFVAKTIADSSVAYDQASSGYVNAIGGRLIQGRELRLTDEDHLARVALVNQSLA